MNAWRSGLVLLAQRRGHPVEGLAQLAQLGRGRLGDVLVEVAGAHRAHRACELLQRPRQCGGHPARQSDRGRERDQQRHQRGQGLPASRPARRDELRVGLVLTVRDEPLDGGERGGDVPLEDVLGVRFAGRPLPEAGLGVAELVDGRAPLTLRPAQGGALARLVEDRWAAQPDRDGDSRAIEVRQLVALALLHVAAAREPRGVQAPQQRDARARLLHDLGSKPVGL